MAPRNTVRSRPLTGSLGTLRNKEDVTREVNSSDAKNHLSQLLNDVEAGASIAISRRGKRVARLVPEPLRRQDGLEEALAELRRIGANARGRGLTVEEILAARHFGHDT